MTLQERFTTLNTTTSAHAQILAEQDKKAKAWHFIFPPLGAFISSYFGKAEWKQGVSGLTTALFDSYAVFVTYAKLWELQKGLTATPPPSEASTSPPSKNSPSDAA